MLIAHISLCELPKYICQLVKDTSVLIIMNYFVSAS